MQELLKIYSGYNQTEFTNEWSAYFGARLPAAVSLGTLLEGFYSITLFNGNPIENIGALFGSFVIPNKGNEPALILSEGDYKYGLKGQPVKIDPTKEAADEMHNCSDR